MRGTKMIIPTPGEKLHGIIYLKEVERNLDGRRFANFKCHCGNKFTAGIYQIINGLTKSCGCHNGKWNRQLTDSQVVAIRHHIWKDNLTLKVIGAKFNVSIATIWYIKNEKTYKDVA